VGNFGKVGQFWELGVGVGVGHFTSYSATLVLTQGFPTFL